MESAIFVGYSRVHQQQIASIVRLLRAAVKGAGDDAASEHQLVFQDVDSIPTGALWDEEIDRAIRSARKVFIFWCEHAAESVEVSREFKLGLKYEKPVWPVLLDRTPLPPELARIQGVDLCDVGLHGDAMRGFAGAPGDQPAEVVVLQRIAGALEVDAAALLKGIGYR